jgi:hypothetical protein
VLQNWHFAQLIEFVAPVVLPRFTLKKADGNDLPVDACHLKHHRDLVCIPAFKEAMQLEFGHVMKPLRKSISLLLGIFL